MQNKTLFIGCGGSGMKTLQRLNELLSGNPANRQKLRENISYMIFDTSVSETEDFKANIRKQLGSAGMPFIKVVQVTRNITNLEEIVRPTFDEFERRSKDMSRKPEERELAAKQLARLKENWWYSPSHEPESDKPCASYPFRAQNITDGLDQGAGQCGPVSFLAAWNYLPSFEHDLREVIEAMQLRNTDNQVTRLNVFIVAGTAGGTGRGCWQPLAFKTAQSLRDLGINCNPTGVFFDSSCFPNVMAGSPNERLNMSVNSLTAMSELSAWMMQPVIRSFYFSLPNLRNPGICEEGKYCTPTDVIAVPEDGDTELSPITNAYLIFGNNGVAPLANNKQYHEMAAAALYAMVAEDKFIGPGAVNRHEAVRSFGAVTFEVETIPIRLYMEALVRREYSKTLYTAAEPRPTKKDEEVESLELSYRLDDEANRIVGEKGKSYAELDNEAKPFFARTQYCFDKDASLESIMPDDTKNATLFRRMMALSAAEVFDWDSDKAARELSPFEVQERKLEAALKKQNVQAAEACVDAIFEVLEDYTPMAALDLLAKYGLDDSHFEQTVKDVVLGAFAPEGKIPSVGRALAVLAKMKSRFVESREHLVGDTDAGCSLAISINDNVQVKSVDECIESFKADVIRPRAKKSLFSKMFSAKDISVIKGALGDYLVCALFFKIRNRSAEKFRKSADMLKKVADSLGLLVKGLEATQRSFETSLCKKCGNGTGDLAEVYKKLFVPETESEIYDNLPKMDSNRNVFQRLLKPIMSQEKVESLVRGSAEVIEAPIRNCMTQFVRDLVKSDVYATPEDAVEAVRKAFVELIASNVSLKFTNGVDFMTANFSFKKVLMNNLKYWNNLLRARKGSEDILGDVMDRLRKFLGVTEESYDKLDDGVLHINSDRIWEDIVTSMAGDCKPWMLLKPEARPTYLSAIALLPVDMEEERVALLKDQVKNRFAGKILSVNHTGDDRGFTLPKDRIVVFSAMAVTAIGDENPFDSIKSLEYYSNAEFSALLKKAEDWKNLEAYYYPITGNPFANVKWGEQRDTHGYVSPIFVMNNGLASVRWRPWDKWVSPINAEKELSDKTLDALLFAFLGSGELSDAGRSAFEEAKAKNLRWSFPLMAQGKKRESVAFRRDPIDPIDDSAWNPDEEYSTILSLRSYLAGEGKTGLQKQGGIALEKSKKAGSAARAVILKELDIFRKTVAVDLGAAVLKQIVDALQAFLNKRANEADGEDRKLWQTLQRRACSEFKLS